MASGEIAGLRVAADDGAGKRREIVLRGRSLHAGIEAPAKCVVAVGESDGGLVESNRGHVCLQHAIVAGHRLAGAASVGHRHRQGELHLPLLRKHLFDVLLVGDRIEGEDADRPPPADVFVEAGPGLGACVGAIVWSLPDAAGCISLGG